MDQIVNPRVQFIPEIDKEPHSYFQQLEDGSEVKDGSELAFSIFQNITPKNLLPNDNFIKIATTQPMLKADSEDSIAQDDQTNSNNTEPLKNLYMLKSGSSDIKVDVDAAKVDVDAAPVFKNSNAGVSKKRKLEDAILRCEWNMCAATMQKMETFLVHIAGHAATVNGPSPNEGYICLWRNCGFTTHSRAELDRHIYFHAFHAKIKGIGERVCEIHNLECTMDDQSHNVIPEIPEPFQCMWESCNFNFTSAQDFYWHVHSHAISVEGKKKQFKCNWKGCTFIGKTLYRLKEHVRRHTQEKVIGCPDCGAIFSSVSKFKDHCYRHKPQEFQSFECSHCKCKFSIERLLKEHIRRHINHFKCPHCEMTCTTRGTMETHIKYRHTNNKPFKCPECSKRFKFQLDVAKHLSSHSVEPGYVCFYPECSYSCRSYSSYFVHVKRFHERTHENPYICHMCDKTFSLGFKLTGHLKKVHDYHWPAGHTRFRYSKDENGYYRLQTTRFESMELAQEFLKEGDHNPDDPDSDVEAGSSVASVCSKDQDTDDDDPPPIQETQGQKPQESKSTEKIEESKMRRGAKCRKVS